MKKSKMFDAIKNISDESEILINAKAYDRKAIELFGEFARLNVA